nr:hypothetical protein [Clostridia bacterium]
MDNSDYRVKLKLDFAEEEKVKDFLAKAYCAFSESIQIDNEISSETFNNFCFSAGVKADLVYYNEYVNSPLIFKFLQKHTDSLVDFIYYFSILVNSCKYKSAEQNSWIKAFNYWASLACLQFDFIEDEKKFFIFPKGAKELDDKLISEPLEWLKDYKLSHKAFIKALKDYSEVDENTASQVADNLRKALETFFQEFFETSQSLENCKSLYGKFMKDKGISTDISNNFETLLQLYTNYNNNNAKHHDKAEIKALEYILYQTGAIIRLLITLKQENK